jgi:hypothetical protein
MRREFPIMAAVLTAYACALVLGSLIICVGAYASDVEGEWATQANAAHVRIDRCSAVLDSRCGVVTWLSDVESLCDKPSIGPARCIGGVDTLGATAPVPQCGTTL